MKKAFISILCVSLFSHLMGQELKLIKSVNLSTPQKPFAVYDIFLDSASNIYAVNGSLGNIIKMDSNFNIKKEWKYLESEKDTLQWPQTIVVDKKGSVYTNEFAKRGIVQFDSNGTFLRRLDNEMWGSLAIDTKGIIYNSGWNKLYSWNPYNGQKETLATDIMNSGGVTMSKGGSFYTASYYNMQKFDKKGKLVKAWDPQDAMHLGSLTTDLEENVYAADSNYIVWKFDSTGNTLAKWEITGGAIKVDGKKRVYVGNAGTIRIYEQVYNPLGNEDTEIGNLLLITHPNPSSGIFKLNRPVQKAEVYDSQGRILKEIRLIDNQLDLTGQKSGVYFVELEMNDKVRREKLVLTNLR